MPDRNVLLVDFRSVVSDFAEELRVFLVENDFAVRVLNENRRHSKIYMPRIFRGYWIIIQVIAYLFNYQKSGSIIFCWPPEYRFELILSRALSWLGRNKIYVIIHNFEHHDTKALYLDCSGARFLDNRSSVVVLSDNVYAQFSTKIDNPIIQCRHPVITKYGYEKSSKLSCMKRNDTICLGSVGGVRPYKNIDKLINYLGLYRNITGRNVLLSILGEDKCDTISRFDSKWISHRNKRFSDTDLRNFLREIDVSVFGYETISQSGAVYLPLAFGIPVFCNNVGDFGELLDIFDTAALKLDVTSYEAFATSMDTLFERQHELLEIGKRQSQYIYNKRCRNVAFSCLLDDLNA
tara:strand:+ start:493 stop:1542 length:1050 start_codon:yes stop_codon:yes gene_type:complete